MIRLMGAACLACGAMGLGLGAIAHLDGRVRDLRGLLVGLECVQRGLSCVPIAVHPSPCCVCCRMGLHTSVQSAGCVEMAGKVLPTPASIRGTEQLLE